MRWNIKKKRLMATDKKSFLFYIDWIDTFRALPKDNAYDLFMHLLAYVNLEKPETEDPLIKALFPIFKNQLKRDLRKWENRSEQQRQNALKRWNKDELNGKDGKPSHPKASDGIPLNPNDADNDNVNVNVNVNDNVNVKDINKRKAEFKNSLLPFLDEYEDEMIEEFFEYWSEHGAKDKKFRKEKQKSFSISRRLKNWKKLSQKFDKDTSKVIEKTNAGTLLKQKYGIS